MMCPDTSLSSGLWSGPPQPDLSRVRCRVETVTPEMARTWMAALTHPRPLFTTTVNAYTRDMAAGTWKLNAAPLIFDQDATLLDGQLRLTACVQAGRPFRTLIVEGVDRESFLSIDQFRRRWLRTILAIRDEQSGTTLAAVLNTLHAYTFNQSDDYRFRPSTQELLYMLDSRPELREAVRFARANRGMLSANVAGALFHLGCRVDADYTRRFFEIFTDAGAAERDHPAVLLRTTLERICAGERAHRRNLMLALAIKAWNAGRAGRTLQQLSWRQSDRHEKLPVVAGLPAGDGDDLIGVAPRSPQKEFTGDELEISVEFVTPEIAASLLARNCANRKIMASVVDRYARDMRAGRWTLNGQTLKLGRSGQLLDGQHRCRASIETGCAFPAIIVRNIDDDVFDTLDLGTRRGFAQVLASRGERNAMVLAAAVRCVAFYLPDPAAVVNPTIRELEDLLTRYPGLRHSASTLPLKRINRFIEASAAIALHFAFSHHDAALAGEFFARLCDGAGLMLHSPILILRNRLIDNRQAMAEALIRHRKIALTIKAWHAFIAAREVRCLGWCERGDRPEPFPRLRWLPDEPAGVEAGTS
jgi:hypothetical protein